MQTLAVPSVSADDLAWITEIDMIEVDRVMIEDLHIELIQMMENAGRALARLILEAASPATAAVAAGPGGNGGGGLVAARHLANAGVEVLVVTTRPHRRTRPQRSRRDRQTRLPNIMTVAGYQTGRRPFQGSRHPPGPAGSERGDRWWALARLTGRQARPPIAGHRHRIQTMTVIEV